MRIVVDPGRPAGLEDLAGYGPLEGISLPHVDVATAARPAAERGHGSVGLETGQSGAIGRNQPGDLGADRCKHLSGRSPLRDAGSYPSQRRLVVREPPDLFPCLTVGDRGRDELCELAEALLGVERQSAFGGRADPKNAPEAPLDDDRRPDSGSPTHIVANDARKRA